MTQRDHKDLTLRHRDHTAVWKYAKAIAIPTIKYYICKYYKSSLLLTLVFLLRLVVIAADIAITIATVVAIWPLLSCCCCSCSCYR